MTPPSASASAPAPESDADVLARIHARGDRLMRGFVLVHVGIALALAPIYSTWAVTLIVGAAAVGMFWTSAVLVPGSFLTRCTAGVALQTFVALHIFQMHGLAEMHFFFFTAFTMMIVYGDWKCMWPGTVLIIGQHILFAVLHNSGVKLYFFEDSYVGVRKLFFHFGIAICHVAIAGYWAHLLRRQALSDARKTATVARSLQLQIEAEQALRASEEQLRHSQKMEAVGRLAGGIAHDFNNLLAAIMGHASLLGERMLAGAPLRGHVDGVLRAADRAGSLTRQLLAFSRKQVLDPKVIDLRDVIAELVPMLKPLVREDIELVVSAGSDVGCVLADRVQMTQVILNLAVNARDAMPHGGRLEIGLADAPAPASSGGAAPGRVVITIRDTGVGMDDQAKKHLFEPFFTTKGPGSGTGLGLSMVYGIVQQSGGEIDVESAPGAGTTVRVSLPRRGREELREEAPRPAPAVAGGAETVLVLEDEEQLRALVVEILRARGYSVLAARDGRTALWLGEDHRGPIDLLVSDVVMPGMSGPDVARALAVDRPSMAVLYMSGYAGNAINRYGVIDSGRDFIAKPFTPAALAEKVREVLDGRGGARPEAARRGSESAPGAATIRSS